MATGIFSTYSQGENRVTAALLAVLRSLALSRTERLLQAFLGEPTFAIVDFRDQLGGGASVPDAAIIAKATVLIETKIVNNSVSEAQLRKHLLKLDRCGTALNYLLVLTPDDAEPSVIAAMNDARVAWVSFAAVSASIDELLDDPRELTSEREAFLLRELQSLFDEMGLLAPAQDTVVVAARMAWGEYLSASAYWCQEDRSFRPVQRIAFYTDNKIHPRIPRILDPLGVLEMTPERHDGAVRQAIEKLLSHRPYVRGGNMQLFLLSPPDAPETLRLAAPIENDVCNAAGRRAAFTQGQRYVQSARLQSARSTSELIDY